MKYRMKDQNRQRKHCPPPKRDKMGSVLAVLLIIYAGLNLVLVIGMIYNAVQAV